MLGDAASYEHRGMAPRAITQLFQEINSRVELEFMISVTYMEIYNERIYDLLVDASNNTNNTTDYTIVEEKDGRGIFVRGLTEVEVRDEASALNLLFSGGLSRTMATHKLNKRSNRSHSIFTLYLQQRQRSGVSERIVHSKLHLVDLAGSERLKKTMGSVDGLGTAAEEVTRKESMAINRSLTYLEQCVVALTRKGQTHVPYRQSKLTNILKDCLGANCNTVMIACMWGESTHLEETISTLRLASRMMKVTNDTISVESVDPAVLLKKQEKIIKALKQELLMHDALVERTGMIYDTYTPEQQAGVAQLIERFVAAPEKEEEEILDIHTYRQMLEVAKVFKKKLIEARTAASNSSMQGMMMLGGNHLNTLDTFADSKDTDMVRSSLNLAATGGNIREVGSAGLNGRGFALGEAKADARPINGIETAANFTYTAPKSPGGASVNGNNMSPIAARRGGGGDAKGSPDSRFDSLLMMSGGNAGGGGGGGGANSIEAFIKASDEGQALFQSFTQARNRSKDTRSKVRALTQEVNTAKADIDRLVSELEGRKQNRLMNAKKGASAKGEEVIDEEEHRLARDLKEAKLRYRNHFEQLQKIQAASTGGSGGELEKSKAALVEAWQRWSNGGSNSSQRWMLDDTAATNNGRDDNNNNGGNGNADELDDQEAFDKLETERVMANDPDSLAFFSAQKTRRANLTQSGGALKMLQRNKRFT